MLLEGRDGHSVIVIRSDGNDQDYEPILALRVLTEEKGVSTQIRMKDLIGSLQELYEKSKKR